MTLNATPLQLKIIQFRQENQWEEVYNHVSQLKTDSVRQKMIDLIEATVNYQKFIDSKWFQFYFFIKLTGETYKFFRIANLVREASHSLGVFRSRNLYKVTDILRCCGWYREALFVAEMIEGRKVRVKVLSQLTRVFLEQKKWELYKRTKALLPAVIRKRLAANLPGRNRFHFTVFKA